MNQRAPLRQAAKETQVKYGVNSQKADLEWARIENMQAPMASNKSSMIAKARPGEWSPKKAGDQRAFRSSCRKKRLNARFPLSQPAECQTMYPATAMVRYNRLQTGPKTQLGGFQEGFCKARYHSPGGVNAPMPAAPKQASKNEKKTSTFLATICPSMQGKKL